MTREANSSSILGLSHKYLSRYGLNHLSFASCACFDIRPIERMEIAWNLFCTLRTLADMVYPGRCLTAGVFFPLLVDQEPLELFARLLQKAGEMTAHLLIK